MKVPAFLIVSSRTYQKAARVWLWTALLLFQQISICIFQMVAFSVPAVSHGVRYLPWESLSRTPRSMLREPVGITGNLREASVGWVWTKTS